MWQRLKDFSSSTDSPPSLCLQDPLVICALARPADKVRLTFLTGLQDFRLPQVRHYGDICAYRVSLCVPQH